MGNFADRLNSAIQATGNACVVGLDPRVDKMPAFATHSRLIASGADVERAITRFHQAVIEAVANVVPAVKLQIAFYEQYGLSGMRAFEQTISDAKSAGLLVIADAKRNDIDSTAEAYATAFLKPSNALFRSWDVDCMTVSPFLGQDSVEPFVRACAAHGKGIFILVKTSNPGSGDLQDRTVDDGRTVSAHLATMVNTLGLPLRGESGYSSIGAVVGATYPSQARALRALMPHAVVLVPGYGAQGGTGESVAANFNPDGRGAIINSSRSLTYAGIEPTTSYGDFTCTVRERVKRMALDISSWIADD